MQKLRQEYCNKGIATRNNGNLQFHDQEESKLNSTIDVNSSAYTLTHNKIINNEFIQNESRGNYEKQIKF